LEPSVKALGHHPAVGSINIEVLIGQDLSCAESRSAGQLDLRYLAGRAA
jgi:hypothetical protein